MTASIMDIGTAHIRGSIQGSDGQVGQKSGTIDNSRHGDGTFEKTFQDVNGEMTRSKTITYADGTTKTSSRAITMNDDGSKTIVKTGANGNVSTIDETKMSTGGGVFGISKTITKADGSTFSVQGTETRTAGETDRSMTRTDNANGLRETLNHQTIRDGNVVTHTTTGTSFDGSKVDRTSTWTALA